MPGRKRNAPGGYGEHVLHRAAGAGPLYQGHLKSYRVQDDDHFYDLCRYVDRNPVRAEFVPWAEKWRRLRAWQRLQSEPTVPLTTRPKDALKLVNRPQNEGERTVLRRADIRGSPLGAGEWQAKDNDGEAARS